MIPGNRPFDLKDETAGTISSQQSMSPGYLQMFGQARWLRFPPKVEAEFISGYNENTIKITRWAFIAGFLIYAVFGIVDIYVAPISLHKVWMIRFGIGCPVLALMVMCTYIKRLYPIMQFLAAITTTIGGVSVVVISAITQPEEIAYSHYYAGLILVMLFTSSWLRLRFWYALATNTIMIISYELAALYLQHLLSSPQGNTFFINNNFFLVGTYFIGAFANYSLELHTRINFLQKRIIEDEKNKVNEQRVALEQQANDLSKALKTLKETQGRLINSEKLASLGELTAGIAHEIKNPLNFVTNFSEVTVELTKDLEAQVAAGNKDEITGLAKSIREFIEKIAFHGNRADSIVKSMLQHSRNSAGEKELADINALIDEYFRLSYQGVRARDRTFNAAMQMDLDENIKTINIVSQDIGRVLLNLFSNAFYSVNHKKKIAGAGFEPIVSVSTKKTDSCVIIRIRDNGMGISQKSMAKLFQPFFTTKPAGEGVGLGLSLSREIITKGHGGSINVDSREGEFAEFIISLPI
jgi:two-component system NtrC family sensor kinase